MFSTTRFTQSPRNPTSPNPNSPANQTGKFDSTSPYGGKETPQNPLIPGFNYGTFPDEAVAEQNQTYFAYFDGIGGMGPEIIDHTAYFIKYIVDDKGNVVNPEPDLTNRDQSNALWNLLDNYESGRGKKAFVKLIEPNPVEINIPKGECIGGLHEITHVGRLANIVVTETGTTNADFIDTMSFGIQAPDGFTANLNLTYRYNTPTGQPFEVPWTDGRYIVYFGSGSLNNPGYNQGTGARIYFNEVDSPNVSWEENDSGVIGRLKILSSSIDSNTKIRFNIYAFIVHYFDSNYFTTQNPTSTNQNIAMQAFDWIEEYFYVTFKIYQNGNVIAQSGPLAIPNVLSNPNYLNFQSEWIADWNEDDTFEVRVFCPNSWWRYTPTSNFDGEQGRIYGPFIASGPGIAGNRIVVEQQTPAGTPEYVEAIPGVNCVYSSYFTASLNFSSSFSGSSIIYPNGSYSLLVLNPTASNIFELNVLQDLPTASAEMKYSPITIPFGSIQPGDYIRFGHNENNVFRIIGVGPFQNFISGSYPEYTDITTFKVFPALSKVQRGSSNLPINHFNIYRILNDGTYIVLKIKKDVPGGPYSGIIQPQYISQELVNNYNQIITNLTDREIIQ
jgi:hypothetical protein